MSKLIILLLGTFLSMNVAFSQPDRVSFNLRHDVYESPLYVLDGLKLDSALFFKLSFNRKQIIKTVPLKTAEAMEKYGDEGKTGAVEVYTKFMIVLNGAELRSQKDKWSALSDLEIDELTTLKQIPCNEAIKLYGQKAKYGLIQISTN